MLLVQDHTETSEAVGHLCPQVSHKGFLELALERRSSLFSCGSCHEVSRLGRPRIWFEKKSGEDESRLYLEAFKGQEEEEQRVQCLEGNSEPHLVCTTRAHKGCLSERSDL